MITTCSSYVQFFRFVSSTSFSKRVASLPEIASLLWYLTEDLSLLDLFDRNVGLTTKFTMVKVSEKVEENKLLSQTHVDTTHRRSQGGPGDNHIKL